MSTNKLKIEFNERIDIPDFEFLTKQSVESNHRQTMGQLITDPNRSQQWIISGFGMSNPLGKQLQVDRGKALLGVRELGIIQYGLLATEGDASKTVDMTSFGVGTFGIYLRFEFAEGESQSRIFWNPAGPGSEYAQTVPTRYLANWSIRVEDISGGSPGAEWLKIGEVDQATMVITDQRPFFFEGEVHNSYQSGWSTDGGGSSNDRNADRSSYGITDFQMFSAAMRQCLGDIKGRGLRSWYSRDIGGLNVGFDANPVEDRIAIGDANNYMELSGVNSSWNLDTGDNLSYDRTTNALTFSIGSSPRFRWNTTQFYPMADNAIDLGIPVTNRFRDGSFSRNIDIGGTLDVGGDTDLGGSLDITDELTVGDTNFKLDLAGTIPTITLDSTDQLLYDRSLNRLALKIGGSDIYRWSASAYYPFTDAAVDLGIPVTNRFRDGSFSRNIAAGGALDITGASTLGGNVAIGTGLHVGATAPGSIYDNDVVIEGGLNVGFTGSDPVNNRLALGSANTYIEGSGITSKWQMESGGDKIEHNGSNVLLEVSGTGYVFTGSALYHNVTTAALGTTSNPWDDLHTQGITFEHPSNANSPIYWNTATSMQAETPILLRIKNVQGATIYKGESVAYNTGALGNAVEVKYCTGPTDDATCGVVYDTSIANNAYGYIAVGGIVLCEITSGIPLPGRHIAAQANGNIANFLANGGNNYITLGQVITWSSTTNWWYCHIRVL